MLFFLASVLVAIGTLLYVNQLVSRIRSGPVRTEYDYDVIVVGGSIAGPVVAKALSDQGKKVLVVERSLFTRPDRIIGELLQPGGLECLRELGMESCALSVGNTCQGYLVVDTKGNNVDLPYREKVTGVSFHFGEFVNNLRKFVFHNCTENVTMIEGTVTNILTERSNFQERAYGIEYTQAVNYQVPANAFEQDPPRAKSGEPVEKKTATAPIVIMCDGGMSKWKSRYQHYSPASDYHSNFIGIVLNKVQLPVEKRGTVFFGKTGPILSYRLDPNELRMLVDYNKPTLPSLEKQSEWLIKEVAPCLPANMRDEFIRVCSDTSNLRSMPVARYPPTFPAIKGYVGIGDHNNQRHPLTGGGMTCAFRDAIRIANNLKSLPSMRSKEQSEMETIEDRIQRCIIDYSRYRYMHSCCINLLSWALYAVFSIPILRDACFDYFVLGGEAVSGPMDLLAGLDPNVGSLVLHYCLVMVNGVFNIMAKAGVYSGGSDKLSISEKAKNIASFFVDIERLKKAGYLLAASTLVVIPIAKNEFFSVWRFIDPTSLLAVVSKRIKMIVYEKARNGKQRKPVGI